MAALTFSILTVGEDSARVMSARDVFFPETARELVIDSNVAADAGNANF